MKTKLIFGLFALLFVFGSSITSAQSRNSYKGSCNYVKVQKYNKKQMKKARRYYAKR
jgi:hypothetical protein